MAWRLISRSTRTGARSTELRPTKRRKRRLWIIPCCLAVLLLAAAAWVRFYIFGTLSTDREFQRHTGQELAVVAPEPETEIEITAPTPQSSEVVAVEEDTGEEIRSVIPEEILEQYYNSGGKVLRRRLLDGAEEIQVFVLYGIDTREDYPSAATDAIKIVGLDPVHHKIKLISISRDTYVCYAPYNSMTKLNYAYTFGGIPGAVSTLNSNFFLNVTDYVAVGMSELNELVDLAGGVTVDLTAEEIRICSALWGMSPGENLLNGEQATAYSRIRSIDNDTVRAGRQYAVILSLMQTAQQTHFSRYPALIRAGLKLCTTSFTTTELLDMATLLLDDQLTVEHYYLPEAGTAWSGGIDGHWYYVYDTLDASDQIHRILYEELYESEYVEE